MIKDNEIRNLFKVESDEHLQKIEALLLSLERDPADRTLLEQMFREAHSLKGAARMVGLAEIESLAHRFEDILGLAKRGEKAILSPVVDRLCEGLDAMRALARQAVTGEPAYVDFAGIQERLAGATATPLAGEAPKAMGKGKPHPHQDEEPSSATVPGIETVRLDTRKLDPLLALAGELAVTRARIALRLPDVEEILNTWDEMEKRELLAPCTASTGKENPMRAATVPPRRETGELRQAVGLLRRLRDAMYEDNAKLEAISSGIEENIRAIRLLPLSTIFTQFPRMARDLAREQGKEIRFTVEGGESQADKRILEEMKDPLMHLIRNAIDHGIEPPDERARLGKPGPGLLRLGAYPSGSNIVIEVADDGRGLNVDLIRQSALKRGLRSEEELASMSAQQIQGLILESGLSTSTFITEISGRGIGLDVVRAGVDRLKGAVQLESAPGRGCCVRLRLPVTLATTRVLLARVGGRIFAFPVECVHTMTSVRPGTVFTAEGRSIIVFEGKPLSVAFLSDLLDMRREDEARADRDAPAACIVLFADGERLGVLVDELLDEQEVILKAAGGLLKRVRNVDGMTILGTGAVCTVLNPYDLIRTVCSPARPAAPVPAPARAPDEKHRILLVEDTILTRTLEQRILEAAGYEVVAAVDGLDALSKLGTRRFDAVVSDIIMPNLDGVAFTERIRQDKRYKDLPVILVTSLADDADKKRGLDAGANAYIPKPAFDQAFFLETLRRLV